MELTAEVIKQYRLEQAQAKTLEEKQELFLRMVRNYNDFAILQHRKMWIWIAKQYAKGSKAELGFLKRKYIMEHCYGAYIRSHCFCCEYSSSQKGTLNMCESCPIQWHYDGCCDDESEYETLIVYIDDYTCIGYNISRYLAFDNFIPKKYYAMLRKETKLKHKVVKLAYKISQLPERKEENED